MTKQAQQQLIIRNAAIIGAETLLSFVLPMISDSITEGRGNWIRAVLHVGPLLAAIQIVTAATSKSLGPPSDA